MQKVRGRDAFILLLFVVGCLGAAAIGGMATASSVDVWYPQLAKPSWNPPDAVFAPVWTLLYVTMAVAAWIVWRHRVGNDVRVALTLFGLQLILNVVWSVIFFGLHRPGLAAMEIVVLWWAILATAVAFGRISKPAGWLLLPYLAWVSFATALNVAIWRLNA